MSYKSIFILCENGTNSWEISLIRGALSFWGIHSKVLGIDSLTESITSQSIIVRIYQGNNENGRYCNPKLQGSRIILTGRKATIRYLKGDLFPEENEILIYGEPYSLIVQLAKDPNLFDHFGGRALLGPLFNPYHYRTLLDMPGHNEWVSIMTSIGCEKECGYCSYGTTYKCLYPGEFSRRERPWQKVEEEIINYLGKGINRFSFLADQFLSEEVEKNKNMYNLASHWNSSLKSRPQIVFTISPLEVVKNKSLIETMARSFSIHPRLSIDSFDNRTLAWFNLSHDANMGLDAAKILAALKLPFRINYIYKRPGMTLNNMKEEFSFIQSLNEVISYMSPKQRGLITEDLFSNELIMFEGAPIAGKLQV